MAPKSKASQQLAKYIEGLSTLAESLGLRWYMNDHGTENIFFDLQDNSTGTVLYGPFKSFSELEDELNSLHLSDVTSRRLS